MTITIWLIALACCTGTILSLAASRNVSTPGKKQRLKGAALLLCLTALAIFGVQYPLQKALFIWLGLLSGVGFAVVLLKPLMQKQ